MDVEWKMNSHGLWMLLKWKLKQIMRNCTQTEEDLDHLGNWVNRWQIQCGIEICKIISLGKRNKSSTDEERSVDYCGKVIEIIKTAHSSREQCKQVIRLL